MLQMVRVGGTSLVIAEVVSTSVAVSAGTTESTKAEFMQPWIILELSLRPKKFPIAISYQMPTTIAFDRQDV